MVKMDIEGGKLGALKGMRHFIEKCESYLSRCLYHKETDLYDIPYFIKQIVPKYCLYIRGHIKCWAVSEHHFEQ